MKPSPSHIFRQASRGPVERFLIRTPPCSLYSTLGTLRHPLVVTEDTEQPDSRENVVILGSGWAGYVLSQHLNPSKYRITVISPRSYFVFTPLLNDTAVGTLEFRNALESVRKRKSSVKFLQGWADDVSFDQKTVTVEPSVLDPDVGHALTGPRQAKQQFIEKGGPDTTAVQTFQVKYDKLVIATGCYSQTFNTPGVKENALFLKDVGDARKIRRRILELFELAVLPIVPEATKRHLLHFAIVGGGPTGMEFAAELSDLIRDDLSKLYPQLMQYIKISLYDVAPKVLPMFDATLSDYAVKLYQRENISIKTSHHVELLRKGFPDDLNAVHHQDKEVKGRVYTLRTREEGDIGIGMCVWSTGNMMNPFVQKALNNVRTYPTRSARLADEPAASSDKSILPGNPQEKSWLIKRDARTGGILVDPQLHVQLVSKSEPTFSSSSSPPPPRPESSSSNNLSSSSSSSPSPPPPSPPPPPPTLNAIMDDVYALGDTAILSPTPLPATAQVANQSALWLAKRLNNKTSLFSSPASETFTYHNLGVMAYLGRQRGIFQGAAPSGDGETGRRAKTLRGFLAFALWRGAYLSMTLSWRNRLLVLYQWIIVWFFGRDVSRF